MQYLPSFGSIAAFVGVGGLSIAVAAYYMQDYLLYFPSMPPGSRTEHLNPHGFGLGKSLVEVMLPSRDGAAQLHLMMFTQSGADKVVDLDDIAAVPTIVFFHGNAGNVSHRLAFFRHLFMKLKVNVVGVEYRGFGKSTGAPSEAALKEDALTVISYVRSREDLFNRQKIVAFGRSLGGAVAIHLARDLEKSGEPLSAVISENTFTSVPAMIPHVMPFMRSLPHSLVTNKWNNEDAVKEIRSTPILLIRGAQDELVPSLMTEKLHDAATAAGNGNVRLETLPDGHHMDTWLQSGYTKRVRSFLTDYHVLER